MILNVMLLLFVMVFVSYLAMLLCEYGERKSKHELWKSLFITAALIFIILHLICTVAFTVSFIWLVVKITF